MGLIKKNVCIYGAYVDEDAVKTSYLTACLFPIQYNEQILQPVFSHMPLMFGLM